MPVDEETKTALGNLNRQIWLLKMEVLVYRQSLIAVANSYPNKAGLLAEFEKVAEHMISDTLTRDYPQELVDQVERQVEQTREFLRKIAQEENQNKGD